MSSKKIDEMSSVAGGAVHGAVKKEMKMTAKVGSTAAVIDPADASKPKNGKKRKVKLAKLSEKKSERSLREAVRNLIFLNRVKYHEEQVKRELQEQKLRRIIRHLLKEGNDSREINFETTGAASGWEFIQKVEKTTFENDFAKGLKSSAEQRETFKAIYLAGIKIYLDSLDQQAKIMHPDDAPTQDMGAMTAPGMAVPQAPIGGMPPAAAPLAEADNVHPAAAPAVPVTPKVPDTKNLQTQAAETALASAQQEFNDRTGHARAFEALNRDLPQIDPLYFNLTFKQITLSSGRSTNDRQEFRYFLIGKGQDKVGNIQLKFNDYENKYPIGKIKKENIPKLNPEPLNTENPAVGTAVAAPTTAPVAGAPNTGLGL